MSLIKRKQLGLVKRDPWLKPYAEAIKGRYDYYLQKKNSLTKGKSLSDFASGYLFFGLHKQKKGWVFREWAPNATSIFLIGEFNNWQENERYALKPIENGNWELLLEENDIKHCTENRAESGVNPCIPQKQCITRGVCRVKLNRKRSCVENVQLISDDGVRIYRICDCKSRQNAENHDSGDYNNGLKDVEKGIKMLCSSHKLICVHVHLSFI